MGTSSAFCAPVVLPSSSGTRPSLSLRTPSCSLAESGSGPIPRRKLLQVAALSLGLSALPGATPAVALAARQQWSHDVLYDQASGSFIPPSSISSLFARDLGTKYDRVIVASEIHDHPRTHAAQLEVLERARQIEDGRPLIVGFEQFYRAHDPFLEQYVAGAISLGALLRVVRWSDTWGYDPALYAPIFQYCRVHRIPMRGLNVPRRLVAYVAQYGLRDMHPELRAFLPQDLDTANPAHFRMFRALMGFSEHTIDPRADMQDVLWRWYEAQVVWDEYMSESVARRLKETPDARFVALIGAGHVQGRVGFPDRIEKRVDERPYTIVPRVVSWSSEQGHAMPDIDEPEKDVADILWYTNRTIDLA